MLQVIHANRNTLEHTLGVDLIYVSNYFKSFIGVQYKMMKGKGSDAVFSPDDGFKKQIRVMDGIIRRLELVEDIPTQIGYRLNSLPFYFKFVSRLETNFIDDKLCPGMYLPIDLLQLLYSGPFPERIGKKHETRHLSNSEFANLVGQGWIGARKNQRQFIEELIQAALDGGRSITVAIATHSDEIRGEEEDPLF